MSRARRTAIAVLAALSLTASGFAVSSTAAGAMNSAGPHFCCR